MLTLAFALIASVAFLSLIGLLQLAQRSSAQRRRDQLKDLELKPNCLLTRYPLVFLATPPSLFSHDDHWNQVPHYLSEHGYDVRVAVWDQKNESLLQTLSQLKSKAHIIADAASERALNELSRASVDFVASLTCVANAGKVVKAAPTVADLKPSNRPIETFPIEVAREELVFDWRTSLNELVQFGFVAKTLSRDPIATAAVRTRTPWAIESKFLDLAVSLAEKDATSFTK